MISEKKKNQKKQCHVFYLNCAINSDVYVWLAIFSTTPEMIKLCYTTFVFICHEFNLVCYKQIFFILFFESCEKSYIIIELFDSVTFHRWLKVEIKILFSFTFIFIFDSVMPIIYAYQISLTFNKYSRAICFMLNFLADYYCRCQLSGSYDQIVRRSNGYPTCSTTSRSDLLC